MIRMKWKYPNLLKGPILNNPSLVVEVKVNNLNKNQKIHHHKHKMISTIMRILTTITIMRIIEVNPEAADPIEAKIQDVPFLQNFHGRGQRNQNAYQGQYQNDGYQSNNYQGNRGFYHNPRRNFSQGNSYGQSRGRSCGQGRGNYRSCGLLP